MEQESTSVSSKPQGLATAAISGMRWNYLGSLVSTLSSLIIGTVLARILGPGPFGQAVVATTIYSLVNLFVDGGFSQALIQQPQVTTDEIRRTFTCQVALGLISTIAVYLAARPIAQLFHVPSAFHVVQAVSVLMTLQSLGLVSAALLRRTMRFRVVQYANLSSYLFSYLALGIPLALAGAGVWSLVAAYLAQSAINSAVLYGASRHPITPSFGAPPRSIAIFGGTVIANNLVYWGHTNLDNMAASYRGAFALGLYGRACNLAYQPCNGAVGSMQSVLLSAVARVGDQKQLVGQMALGSTVVMLALLGPAYGAFVASPETVIVGLYGWHWAAAIPLMIPLALAMPLFGCVRLLNSVLCGIGHPELEFWPQAGTCVLAAAAYFAAIRISLVAVAWAVLGIMLLRFLLAAGAVFSRLEVSWERVATATTGRLLFSLAFTLCSWAFDRAVMHAGLQPSGRLAALFAFCSLLLIGCVWFLSPLVFGREAMTLMQKYSSHLPSAYRRRLRPVGVGAQPIRAL